MPNTAISDYGKLLVLPAMFNSAQTRRMDFGFQKIPEKSSISGPRKHWPHKNNPLVLTNQRSSTSMQSM